MVLLLLIALAVVLVALVADFLLPFYYLLTSSSRLFTVLTASMSPIPKQKPTIPIPIKDPITSDLLEVNNFGHFCLTRRVAGPSLSPLLPPFLLCSDK